jgi:hypothetical protein
MAYRIALRKNATGEVRFHEEPNDWREGCSYQCLCGNYSCYCNRHLFFERAGGNDPELFRHEWGEDAYTVI